MTPEELQNYYLNKRSEKVENTALADHLSNAKDRAKKAEESAKK
jgi:hypothetical protein